MQVTLLSVCPTHTKCVQWLSEVIYPRTQNTMGNFKQIPIPVILAVISLLVNRGPILMKFRISNPSRLPRLLYFIYKRASEV